MGILHSTYALETCLIVYRTFDYSYFARWVSRAGAVAQRGEAETSRSEGRPAKLRRLFVGDGVPHQQIEKLLALLRKEENLEDALGADRKALGRSMDDLRRSVGEVEQLTTVDGGKFECSTASLPNSLPHVVLRSPAWAEDFRLASDRRPCTQASPFHLLVYTDEATQCNVLRLDNRRKLAAMYVAIQEIRQERHKHDGMWLPAACIRSSVAKSVAGGLYAEVVQAVLHRRCAWRKRGAVGSEHHRRRRLEHLSRRRAARERRRGLEVCVVQQGRIGQITLPQL